MYRTERQTDRRYRNVADAFGRCRRFWLAALRQAAVASCAPAIQVSRRHSVSVLTANFKVDLG